MAAGDLTTVTKVKTEWLKISVATDDAILQALITAASRQIVSYLQRSVLSATFTEKRNGTGTSMIVLKHWPVTAITSVTVNASVIPASSQGSYGWVCNLWDGSTFPIPPAVIQLVGGGYSGFPPYSIPAAPGVFNEGGQNIQIVYTAGFSTTPPDIEMACNMLVGAWYKEKDLIRQKSSLLGGQSQSYEMDMPTSCKNLLNPYRAVAPLVP